MQRPTDNSTPYMRVVLHIAGTYKFWSLPSDPHISHMIILQPYPSNLSETVDRDLSKETFFLNGILLYHIRYRLVKDLTKVTLTLPVTLLALTLLTITLPVVIHVTST